MKFIPSCCTKHNQISVYVIFFSICDENKIKGEANVDHLQWNRVTWLWSRHLSCHYPESDGIALENAKTVISVQMHTHTCMHICTHNMLPNCHFTLEPAYSSWEKPNTAKPFCSTVGNHSPVQLWISSLWILHPSSLASSDSLTWGFWLVPPEAFTWGILESTMSQSHWTKCSQQFWGQGNWWVSLDRFSPLNPIEKFDHALYIKALNLL